MLIWIIVVVFKVQSYSRIFFLKKKQSVLVRALNLEVCSRFAKHRF